MNRFSVSLLVAMATPLFWMIACSAPIPGGSAGGAATTTSSTGAGCPAPDPVAPGMAPACPAPVEEPCLRYHIPLAGNPSFDIALRNKYIAAFGDACYVSEVGTFGCFYKKWQDACDDAVKIGEVSGNAPYDKGHACQPDGAGNYTLQIGPDVANKIVINYQAAPRQTALVEVNGMPTEVSGPYRNLAEPPTLGPGQPFNNCDSGMVDADGGSLSQTSWILQINRNANNGGVRSDLAGFKWPCKDEDCKPTTCEEPLILGDPAKKPLQYPDTEAQVHHVVPMTDKRGCSWGTNSNRNAAVISRKLNQYFSNNNPPVDEVKQLNVTVRPATAGWPLFLGASCVPQDA